MNLNSLQDSITQGLHGIIVNENEFENNVPYSFMYVSLLVLVYYYTELTHFSARVLDDDVQSLEEDPKVESVTKVKDDPNFA